MDKPGPVKKTHSGRLAEINRAITTSLNFDQVLGIIVESALQLVEARACVLLLIEKDGTFRVRAARGTTPEFAAEFSASMDEDAVRKLHQALAVTPDEAMVSVPVIATNAVNGMLAVVRDRPLDADEEWQLSAIADQAAIALQNARLFEIESAEAKRLRDATEIARRHLASIVESSDDAIISKNLDGIIQSWNEAASRVFGYSADEVIGRHITMLLPQDRLNEETLIIEKIRRGERVDHFETVRRRKDGSLIDVSLTISPIKNQEGRVVGASKIARDITQRKKTEAERDELLKREHEARADAEAANRLKDEFLATLSHELRNPLNAVVGYAEILLRSKETRHNELVIKAAETIRRNALAQTRLVSDLLDLSRLQMGKLSLEFQPLSLSTILTDAIDTVRDEANAKDISLEVAIGSDVVVEGDPIRLGQIAWNLLNNAVKFTAAGGKVSIAVKRSSNAAEFVVSDTGQGIGSDFLPHVFEIFRQGDASSVRRQGGLGIGLALVKQLAELHRGHVKVDSKGVGHGATFTVTVPLYETEDQYAAPKPATSVELLKGKTILIVDDSRDTIDMLTKLLTLEGARVESAGSGKEALQIAGERSFDLIISDISMPEMDGYQLLKQIRRLAKGENLPALALTGYGRSHDITRAQAEGFADHLTKPIDINRFLRTVRRLTDGP
ncbi:MAG TPA: PAS domain S-box protein [Pyrinomonadaceae bacterium]|nr:PAS domain S-box protein [Pyrinomonadaceae bacterium]